MSVGLRYRFGAGWKFVRIEPKAAAARKIEGGPRAFGIWVHGDGQGGTPCIRLRDPRETLEVRYWVHGVDWVLGFTEAARFRRRTTV